MHYPSISSSVKWGHQPLSLRVFRGLNTNPTASNLMLPGARCQITIQDAAKCCWSKASNLVPLTSFSCPTSFSSLDHLCGPWCSGLLSIKWGLKEPNFMPSQVKYPSRSISPICFILSNVAGQWPPKWRLPQVCFLYTVPPLCQPHQLWGVIHFNEPQSPAHLLWGSAFSPNPSRPVKEDFFL
jgi:hypothetical protein